MEYIRRWDPKLRTKVLVEVGPKSCPAGHVVNQRPGWRGCYPRGHRIWRCDECDAVTIDGECGCAVRESAT